MYVPKRWYARECVCATEGKNEEERKREREREREKEREMKTQSKGSKDVLERSEDVFLVCFVHQTQCSACARVCVCERERE